MLLEFFTAVADETRLKIVGTLSQKDYLIHELAEIFQFTEDEVAQHIRPLREIGLVNLNTRQNQHLYSLNIGVLRDMQRRVAEKQAEAELGQEDTSWLDVLDFAEWEIQILKNYTRRQKLTYIPEKNKRFKVVVRWLATFFESERVYTEGEVNEIIEQVNADYATLRRGLVDYGHLQRKRDGSGYWIADSA